MKLSDAVMEIEEWLDYFTYDYQIDSVEVKSESEFVIHFWELNPSGEYTTDDTDFFTIEDGVLINSNGNDVVDVGQEVYSDQDELIEWLKRFEEKWYKKGE